MSYEVENDRTLNFIECVQLLNILKENEILNEDPSNKENLIIYHGKNEHLGYMEEGWYSIPINDIASELRGDEEGQKYLRNILEENSIELVFEGERILSSYITDSENMDETEIL